MCDEVDEALLPVEEIEGIKVVVVLDIGDYYAFIARPLHAVDVVPWLQRLELSGTMHIGLGETHIPLVLIHRHVPMAVLLIAPAVEAPSWAFVHSANDRPKLFYVAFEGHVPSSVSSA